MRIISYSVLALFSCTTSSQPDLPEMDDFAYRLMEPKHTAELPRKLEEISGLSLSPDQQSLICVEDENGRVYFLDKDSGEIQREVDFWKDGDYEGIETVGEEIFVLKSTGTLYRILRIGREDQEVIKYNGKLNGNHNVEGLAYDSLGHRLLLACKAQAGDGEEYMLSKAIYAFDLDSMALQPDPAYLISLNEINDYLQTHTALRKWEKMVEFFQPGHSELTFAPSALAIHPFSKDIYVLSSVGKLLLVMSPEGDVIHLERLSKDIHAQPEGICFDRDGHLYISNEGKKGKAVLHHFDYRSE